MDPSEQFPPPPLSPEMKRVFARLDEWAQSRGYENAHEWMREQWAKVLLAASERQTQTKLPPAPR